MLFHVKLARVQGKPPRDPPLSLSRRFKSATDSLLGARDVGSSESIPVFATNRSSDDIRPNSPPTTRVTVVRVDANIILVACTQANTGSTSLESPIQKPIKSR